MARDKTLLILHCPAGGGHRAAAEALAASARERGLNPQVIDALSAAPPWFAQLYVQAHLTASAHVPALYGGAYAATNHAIHCGGAAPLTTRVDRWLGGDLTRAVSAARPFAVVATHFFPVRNLLRAQLTGELSAPVIEVVTDFAAHAVWAEPGADAYCAPAGAACADLIRHGVDASRVFATGIPVRSAFGRCAERARASDAPLQVLITSGGFGIGPMESVVRSFAAITGVALTIVCGANPELERRMRGICGALRLNAQVCGFERDMVARVAAADVVVTKPGGLTVSECLAAGRPLVFVGAVPGQETLNLQWVVDHRAGVAARPHEVATAVTTLRDDRARLYAMAACAAALGSPRAADAVLDVVIAAERRRSSRRATAPRSLAPRVM